jgi:tetratricopeptide (TPR) repeat protein
LQDNEIFRIKGSELDRTVFYRRAAVFGGIFVSRQPDTPACHSILIFCLNQTVQTKNIVVKTEMGAFFESIHIRTEKIEEVQPALRRIAKDTGGKFFISPALNGWIGVFFSEIIERDRVLTGIAERLPNDIFHVNVHDDDIFTYAFYRGGQLIDQYNSCPDYFGEVSDEEKAAGQGHPELFQDLLGGRNSLSQLKTLLTAKKFTFESERVAEFARLLGLSNVQASYDLLRAGDQREDEIEGWKQFVHIEDQPESADDYRDRGKAKSAKGDLDGALADFDKAIELKPDSASAYNDRGRIKRTKKDFDGALADFNRAIELKNDFAQAYNSRGLVKVAKKDLDGAMSDYNRALELQPDLAAAYNNRGELRRGKSDWDGAVADYTRAIEQQPEMAVAYNNRGEVKRIKGDMAGALIDFNRAIELKPDSGKIHNNRAELKRVTGDLEGALADYNRALELQPDLISVFSNRGLLKQAKGDFKGALADLDRAIELNPKFSIAYNNRARAKHAQRNYEGALSDYHQAIELNPEQYQFHGNRGDTRRAQGDFDGAIVDYNRAIELQPTWADIYNCRGEAKRAKRDFEGAIADYSRAIEIKPALAAAYNNRGLAKKEKGDLDGALGDCDRAVQLMPRSAQAVSNRGTVKRAKGDLEGALADFNLAIEIKPDLGKAIENRHEVRTALRKAKGGNVVNPNEIPATENTLALRTDFADEAAWSALCAVIQNPDADFTANVDLVNDPKYGGLQADQLLALLPADSFQPIAFIIDREALTRPDHPILVVDLQDEPGRTFRVVGSALWAVENNLSIANMEFSEFAEAVDEDGIFRGF